MLTAGKGIGKSSSLLVTTVSELESTVGKRRPLPLESASPLDQRDQPEMVSSPAARSTSLSCAAMVVAEQVTTTSGSITLAPINNPAPGEDFTLESGVTISTQGGAVTIDAAGNVTLSSGSSISTNPTS